MVNASPSKDCLGLKVLHVLSSTSSPGCMRTTNCILCPNMFHSSLSIFLLYNRLVGLSIYHAPWVNYIMMRLEPGSYHSSLLGFMRRQRCQHEDKTPKQLTPPSNAQEYCMNWGHSRFTKLANQKSKNGDERCFVDCLGKITSAIQQIIEQSPIH